MSGLIAEYLPSVLMVIFGMVLTGLDRKRTKRVEEREHNQAELFRHLGQCMKANNRGTLALASAYKNNDRNGGLGDAMDKIGNADEQLEDFMNSIAIRTLARGR